MQRYSMDDLPFGAKIRNPGRRTARALTAGALDSIRAALTLIG